MANKGLLESSNFEIFYSFVNREKFQIPTASTSPMVDVEILIAGDGKNYPRAGTTVIINNDAFLPNGVQFDSVSGTRCIAKFFMCT